MNQERAVKDAWTHAIRAKDSLSLAAALCPDEPKRQRLMNLEARARAIAYECGIALGESRT